jgi:hypothetical protein
MTPPNRSGVGWRFGNQWRSEGSIWPCCIRECQGMEPTMLRMELTTLTDETNDVDDGTIDVNEWT